MVGAKNDPLRDGPPRGHAIRPRGGRSVRRRGVTLVEVMIASALSVLVSAALGGLIYMVMRIDKSIFSQQHSLHHAKKAMEALNLEVRLATTPLIVFDGDGNIAAQGNRVEFTRADEATVRSFELISADDDLATPWDNTFVYDPDVDTAGNEIIVARGIAPVEPAGAFRYEGARSPLVALMRTGDWIPEDPDTAGMESLAHAQTGPGLQGVEINITISPRNPSNL